MVYELLPLFPLPNEAAQVGEGIKANSPSFPTHPVPQPRCRHALALRGYFPIPAPLLRLAGALCSSVYSPAAGDERRIPLAGTFVGNHIPLHVCARPSAPASPRPARPRSRFCSHYSPQSELGVRGSGWATQWGRVGIFRAFDAWGWVGMKAAGLG